jgi:hypothetical protein
VLFEQSVKSGNPHQKSVRAMKAAFFCRKRQPPEVWAFEIGGYQVLHQWLKDRRERILNDEDQIQNQQIVVALTETNCLMAEIDTVIPAWPIGKV